MLSSTVFVIFALLPTFGFAAPAATPSASKSKTTKAAAPTAGAGNDGATQDNGGAQGGAQGGAGVPMSMMAPSDAQIGNAVMSWMNDTGKVTKFLNTATGLTGDEFTKQATIAFNAEVDELNHKMILDAALGQMDTIQAANNTLATQGNFQAVVDALDTMVKQGPDTAQQMVDVINMNRCVNVLPNIDMYFAAAGSANVQSVRPTGCLEVNVQAAMSSAAMSKAPASTASANQTGAADGMAADVPSATSGGDAMGAAQSTTASKANAKASGGAAAKATGASADGADAGATSTSKVASAKAASATPKAAGAAAGAGGAGGAKPKSSSSPKSAGAAKAKATAA